MIALERLRYADGQPLAIMRNWIPPGLVQLTPELLERAGLYQVMRAAGIRLRLASQTIGARAASAAEARLLHGRKGEPRGQVSAAVTPAGRARPGSRSRSLRTRPWPPPPGRP